MVMPKCPVEMGASSDRFRANFAAQGSFMDGDQMSMQDYNLCVE